MTKNLLTALVLTFVLFPIASYAQEHVVIDVGYIGGDLTRTIQFPSTPGPNLKHGNDYVVNGINIRAAVKVAKDYFDDPVVIIMGRYQHKALGNAQNFNEMLSKEFRGRHSEPDTSANGQRMDYVEIASSFNLPKTHGHSLLVGVARTTIDRHWRWEDAFGGVYRGEDRDEYTGLVYGIAGTQKAHALTFDYAARSYYHLMLKENSAPNKLPASGYELGVSVTWAIANHFGVSGGYEFRRLHTEVGNVPFESIENFDDYGPVIRIRTSF